MSNRNWQRERYADPDYRFLRHDERFGERHRDDSGLDHPGWLDPSRRDVPPEWWGEEGLHRDEPAHRRGEHFREAYPQDEGQLARPGASGPIGDVRRYGREDSRRMARELERARQGEFGAASGYHRQGQWGTDAGGDAGGRPSPADMPPLRAGRDECYDSSYARDFAGYGAGHDRYGRDFQSSASPGWRQSDPRQTARLHRGPKGYQRSDERIREDICEQLAQRCDLDVSEVSVDVQAGKVTLEGSVCERYVKHAIEDVADDCFGVKEVDNRIRVVRSDYRERNPLSIGSGSGGSGSSGSSTTESSSTSIGSPASGGTQGLSGTSIDKGK